MSQELEVINVSIVEEAKDLMGDRFPTMVKYFLEDTEMYISEIWASIEEKDITMAISPAHTIKSSAKQIGAERISDVARQIEQFCRDSEGQVGDFEHLDRLYQELKEEMDAAVPLLEEMAE